MHAVISLLLQSRKFWWYLLLTASGRYNDVILLRRMSGNDFMFQQDRTPAHHATHMQQINCCIKKRQTFLRPTCGLQTVQISILWITRSVLSWSILSTTDKSIVWMNWNGGSLMSDAVLNSWFLMRLLTSGEEDIERMSVLREDISNTICELTVLILSISVTFNVTCLTVTSLFTTSCQHRWSIHSCMGARRIFCRWGQTVALTKARENFFKSCMLLYTSFSAFLGELKLILSIISAF